VNLTWTGFLVFSILWAPKGWSRLHQLAQGINLRPALWEPKLPGVRTWLGLQPASQPKPPRAPPFDMQRWWAANKPASCLWDGWSSKSFLEIPRQVLGRWIQEVSGHGDFAEYHQRFGHPPEATKTCMCGQAVRRGHLSVCPIATWGNPDATRLDARAFYKTFNLYLSRVNELRQYGEILDPLTLEPLPIPRRPPPDLPSPSVSADEEDGSEFLEIVIPQALPSS